MSLIGRTLKIALLKCEQLSEHLPPAVYAKTGGYLELLQRTFDHVCEPASQVNLSSGGDFDLEEPGSGLELVNSSVKVDLTAYNVKAGAYPENPSNYDGVLISGSLSGVYDPDPWIQQLLERIREYDARRIRMCGISFGHQAIAQALGGSVHKNPKGSEVSVREVSLTPEARRYFMTRRQSFRLMYHHNDTILSLPPPPAGALHVAGGNNVTRFQGLFKEDYILTFCGEKLWVHEQLVEMSLQTLNQKTDYEWVTKQIILFYMGLRKYPRDD
eukprot:jgi/Mesen1/9328/ME000061S08773